MIKTALNLRFLIRRGKWLFSLVYPKVKRPSIFILGPIALWSFAFILILLLSCRLVSYLVAKGRNILAVCSFFIICILIYLIVLLTGRPAVFFETELFSAYQFSLNDFIPSLGHLLILSVLVSVCAWLFYRFFPILKPQAENRFSAWLLLSLLLLPGAVFLLLYHQIFTQLISNSNINFEPYKVLDLSVYSFIGFFSLILLLLVPVFYLLKVFRENQHLKTGTVILSIFTSLVVFAGASLIDSNNYLFLAIFYLFISVSFCLTIRSRIGRFNLTVMFSLLFGLYSLYYIIVLSEEKTNENTKVLAVSYSSENDPQAEQLLLDLWPGISSDTTLKRMLEGDLSGQRDVDNIYDYLHEIYFNGYLGNFILSVVPCRNDSPLLIASEENMRDNCFSYFNEKIRKDGHQLTGTGFYFLDNQGGRSYYTGRLFYKLGNNMTNGLFIELYSDVDAFQAGYSELLLDKKYQGYVRLKDRSFAKYIERRNPMPVPVL